MGFRVFFGVRDAAATRGQYLALIKAWWSCFFSYKYVTASALCHLLAIKKVN